MPSTPTYALPYPSLSDAPNGPAQLQSLATATETAIGTLATAYNSLAPKLGEVVAPTMIATSSSSANSATLVVTNVIAQFTPVASGARYRFKVNGLYQCDAASNTCGFYVVWKHGSSIAITDPIVYKTLDRSHPNGTGINHIDLEGEFVSTATTQITVGVCVAMPNLSGSDPGPVRMYATATGGAFGSWVSVDRIG